MSALSPSDIASALLEKQGLRLRSLNVLQRLWAGYGFVCQVTACPLSSPDSSGQTSAAGSSANSGASSPLQEQSYILKLIAPPPARDDDDGHLRKVLSYQVEQYFYTRLAPRMPASIPVAKCFASINEHHGDGTSTTAMMLTDLRQAFPVAGEKRGVLDETQVYAALDWLSSFHGFWWDHAKNRISLVKPPLEEGNVNRPYTIWLNGGYTYLATRRKEYQNLKADTSSEWCKPLTEPLEEGLALAEMVAVVLAPKERGWSPTDDYQTVIHGDVKSENLFTTTSGKHVAFYDFQYVGLGLGVCDLAKLFTCSVPLDMLVDERKSICQELDMQAGEKRLLELYLANVKEVSGKKYEWDVFVRHWETALVDWLRFQASWGFWGNTEWLEARVRSIMKDDGWRTGVVDAYRST